MKNILKSVINKQVFINKREVNSLKQKIIFVVFFLLAIISIFLMTKVEVNYDLSKYLPSDENASIGLRIYEDQYGESSTANLVLKFDSETTLSEILQVSTDLSQIENVSSVLFLDDYLNQSMFDQIKAAADPYTQAYLEQLEANMLLTGGTYTELIVNLYNASPTTMSSVGDYIDTFYHEANHTAYFQIVFGVSAASSLTEPALNAVKDVASAISIDYYLSGNAASTVYTRNTITKEVFNITIIIIPIILIILLFMTPSFFDLVIFGVVAGVSILLNLGTNAFLPNISFVTQSMAIALQLAISLDYIIFIVNRYHKEKDLGLSTDEAIKAAMKKVYQPVIASALTTGVSFLALIFMRFSIGMDIGLVFFKAIVFSLIASLTLLPALIKVGDKLILKSKHKVFLPRFGKFAKFIYKFRYAFLVFLIAIIVPAYYFQSHNNFIYGDTALTAAEGSSYYEDVKFIEDNYGLQNQIIILTNKDQAVEASLVQTLMSDTSLQITKIESGVMYLSQISDPVILQNILAKFYTEDYSIIILTVNLPVESADTKLMVTSLRQIVSDSGYSEYYLLGQSPIAYSIEDVIRVDYLIVSIIAVISIMIIILLTFKNFIMPLILPLVIVSSVFLTMSIPYFAGERVVFLGYLIVSTILLGATIDYAILLGKRYLELRVDHQKNESIMIAIEDSAPSIFTSALIFSVSGFSLYFVSSIMTISQIGLTIATGAIISMFFVLVILPQLLFIFDKWMKKANFKK